MPHFFNNSCCYLLGLCPFECETLLLCTDGAFMRKSGKIPVLSRALAALPFLLSADETNKTKQRNHGGWGCF